MFRFVPFRSWDGGVIGAEMEHEQGMNGTWTVQEWNTNGTRSVRPIPCEPKYRLQGRVADKRRVTMFMRLY